MLSPYIPPIIDDAPKVRIPKNARCPLVALLVPKGVQATQDILPHLKNMTFVNHDV